MAIAKWTCVSLVAYAPGNIAVNVTWIEREFNAGQTRRSMYAPIFNRLRAIATFSYHLAFNAPVRSGPSDNRGKCYTVGKRIQCNTFTAIHLPRLSEGRTQGRPKCAKNVLKWRIFKLLVWITGKRLKIDGYIQGIYAFHSNYGRTCSHFGDIQRQRIWPDLEIWVWRPSRSLKKARFDRTCMTFY